MATPDQQAEEYRVRAEYCFSEARTYTKPQTRDEMFELGHKWLKMADECESRQHEYVVKKWRG